MRLPLGLFSWVDRLSCPQFSSYNIPSSPVNNFVFLLKMLSSTLISFLHCGSPNCVQYSRWGHNNTKYSARIIFFNLLAVFNKIQDVFCLLGWLGTLLAHVEPAVNPQISYCLTALQPLFSLCLCLSLLQQSCWTHHFPLLNFIQIC